MKQLIQALTAYTSTLEQQLAALESRVAQLEAQLEEANEAIRLLGEKAKSEEPEVEVELVMEDDEVLDALEGLDSLDILEEIGDTTEPEPVSEPIIEPMAEQVVEPIIEAEPELVVEPEPIVVPEPIMEPAVELEPTVEPAPVVEKLAPRPAPTQTSLFGSAVEDIRQAISLGDRFLFQRELFAGNGELMQKTLGELNDLGSLSEAMEYIAENFEWDKESTAVQLFENVLRRRFQ